MKAVVLAAGVGSRLDPLTSLLPKPLVPIANAPVLEHIFNLLKKHGVTEVYANLHYMPEKLQEHFKDGSEFGIKLTFHVEEKLSGDAGGVRAMKDHLNDGTFLVLMGDLLTDADLTAIIKQHKEKGALASIGVKPVEDVERFGVVVRDDNGFITGFQEKPAREEALSNMISTGIYVLEPSVFDHMPKEGEYGFGRQLFPKLVADGLPVLGIDIDGYWNDVGTIEQYRISNFDALNHHLKVELHGEEKQFASGGKSYLGSGSKIGKDFDVQGSALIGKNCTIENNVKFKGSVIIGDDVTIEEGAELTNAIVWDNSRICAKSKLVDTVIGFSCTIPANTKLKEVAEVSAR